MGLDYLWNNHNHSQTLSSYYSPGVEREGGKNPDERFWQYPGHRRKHAENKLNPGASRGPAD